MLLRRLLKMTPAKRHMQERENELHRDTEQKRQMPKGWSFVVFLPSGYKRYLGHLTIFPGSVSCQKFEFHYFSLRQLKNLNPNASVIMNPILRRFNPFHSGDLSTRINSICYDCMNHGHNY